MRKTVNMNAYTADGMPKYLRIYDNGGETFDRYTVVYTRTNDGWQHYLTMSENPFSPFGVGVHDSVHAHAPIDRPSYRHLGRKIGFSDLPTDCKRAVMNDYIELWGRFPNEGSN